MSEPKIGSWHYEQDLKKDGTPIAYSFSVWKAIDPAPGSDESFFHVGTVSTESNARLIAAAPELLACLEEQTRLLDQYLSGALVVFPSAIRHQSKAAIAKATGN